MIKRWLLVVALAALTAATGTFTAAGVRMLGPSRELTSERVRALGQGTGCFGLDASRRRLASKVLLAQLRRGKAIACRGVTLRGTLDLTNLELVRRPLKCVNCKIQGSLLASDVIFKRIVDLRGTEISGFVAMAAATFQGPALFGLGPQARGSFQRQVNFSLATFKDLADFESATFVQRADFTLAKFQSDAIFVDAHFNGDAIFKETAFAGDARFDQIRFDGRAQFERAKFSAVADFHQSEFESLSVFKRVEFEGRANFSQGWFTKEADFARSRFTEETTFLGRDFEGEDSKLALNFDHTRAAGALDFAGTDFEARAHFTHAVFATVSFKGADFYGGVAMSEMTAADLLMSVHSADLVTDDEPHVLKLIESSAKARDDLAVANDAHYRLRVLKSDGYGWLLRGLDVFFYRWIGGYLVRPKNPLLAWLSLAFVVFLGRGAGGSLWELRRRGRLGAATHPDEEGIPPSVWQTVSQGIARGANKLVDTLTVVWHRRQDTEGGQWSRLGRRVEVFVYRALIVCMLIGFANSNPTLRQMLDALL